MKPAHFNMGEMGKKKATTKTSRSNLAMNLQVARTLYGWSQEQLGLECDLKRTYIGALERGEINPGLDNVERVAGAFSLPAHVLILPPEEAHALIYRARQKR